MAQAQPKQAKLNPDAAPGPVVERARDTVVVASRLPMAIFMQCCSKRIEQRVYQGSTWKEEVSFKTGPIAKIAGTARVNGPVSLDENDDRPAQAELAYGAALTPNVPRSLWDKWLKENEDTALVKNGLIGAGKDREEALAWARDHRGAMSGLDPLRPDHNDPRLPKKVAASQIRQQATSGLLGAE